MLHFVEERAKCVRRLVLINSEGYWSGKAPPTQGYRPGMRILSRVICKHLLLLRNAQAAALLACLAKAVGQSGPKELRRWRRTPLCGAAGDVSLHALQPAWLEAPCAVHAK